MKMIENFDKAVKNIRQEFENYILKSNLKSVVLGLSGGIDSAICAALAYDVCQKNNINLIGRSIAIETNKIDENQRGRMIGEVYTTDYQHIDLTDTYLKLRPDVVENSENEDVTNLSFKLRMGNIKARLRMIYLYELAAKHKGMVLSTDNLTELLLGFWTLHGDVGDYAMIQQLWKTEVYQMSEFIANHEADAQQREALLACINATPTDGLGITDSDLEQLQANSYFEVDKILISYLYENKTEFENHPVIDRHKKSEYKRNNPFALNRNIYFK